MHLPPTRIPSCFCDIPNIGKAYYSHGRTNLNHSISTLVKWDGKEHWLLPLSSTRREEAVPQLGVDRGSHPLPVSKAAMKEGKGSQDGAGPGDKAQGEAVVERSHGNINHILCNRGKNSQMISILDLQDDFLT